MLYQVGRYGEAEPFFKQALAIREKVLGPDHLDTATSLNDLAAVYRGQGRFAEAELLHRRALAIREKALGPDHPDTATSLNNLAFLSYTQGRYGEAEPLFRRVLAITENAFGPDHPDTATGLNNLAGLYGDQGRHSEAEPLHRRALAIREKALGPDHPDTATSLNNLAFLSYTQGRYGEAEPLLRRALAITEKALGLDHPDTATGLNNLAGLYRDQGRYAEAEPLHRRALAIRERALGPDHADTATSLNNLAFLYNSQGRYGEAEPLYRRALATREKALGPDHPDTATGLNNLAGLYRVQGRYAEAEPLYRRALTIHEKALGPDHPSIATSLNNLGVFYEAQSRYVEAELLYRRALAIREKALGPDHPDTATSLNNLAFLYNSQGRYGEAEPLIRRALAVWETVLGPDHTNTATSLNNLAAFYETQSRYVEAEPLYRRALAIREKALGPDHPDTATGLNNLAFLYYTQGRYTEAEPLYRRALAIHEKALGPDHPDTATSLNNLAALYETQTRYAEAEPLYRRALAIREKALGPDHPNTATSLNNLAGLYRVDGRYAEAEPLHRRALAIREKALGPDHPDTATSLNNLATLYQTQRRYGEAEPLYRRALAIHEKAFGLDHPNTATSLNNLAFLAEGHQRPEEVWQLFGRATSIYIQRARRSAAQALERTTRPGQQEIGANQSTFLGQIRVAWALAAREPRRLPSLTAETWDLVQWQQQPEAAAALFQMAARFAKGDDALARLVRRRQDLLGQYEAIDILLVASASRLPAERNANVEADWLTQLAGIDREIQAINARLKAEFPDYAAVAHPEPLSIAQVQAQLRPDEALYQVVVRENNAFLWLATRETVRWHKLDVTTQLIGEQVAALRCGLDEAEWKGIEKPARCKRLLGVEKPAKTQPLPFHAGIAHALYQELFGPIEDLIQGKRLLIVPSGPLTSLPFQVLVTEKPETDLPGTYEGYRPIVWFGKSQAMAVLPSVASLRALREFSKSGRAPLAFLGYGDPRLDGNGTCREEEDDSEAIPPSAGKSACGVDVARTRRSVTHSGSLGASLDRVFRSGAGTAALLEEVRQLCPLRNTADELRCVARSLGAPESEIRLGDAATESDIKALSGSEKLDDFRIMHFATHGLLAGEVELMGKRQGEPALVLTPPAKPKDEDDDGLLTASEVAQLRLNADWVVLSACNTAAGDKVGAEALSGLARAFFYAGTRALLVSHWPVYSDAAVRLTSRAFAAMERDPTLGRAEAMREAMVALIEDPAQEDNAHPAVWAPFALVGEAGR